MSVKRLVAVSDLHFGSVSGLLPVDFKTSDGIEIPLNSAQKYLWACWLDFCGKARKFHPDAIIINGDIVEGTQPKEGGLGLSLRLLNDQIAAAIQGLKHLSCSFAKLYITAGTRYHTGECGMAEEHIAEVLGATEYYSVGSGRLVREVLWLDVDGVIVEAFHAIGGTSGLYRATPMDREMQWSSMSAKDSSKGVPKADLLIRSHVHNFISLEHASKQGVVLPCFQLQTPYARKSSIHRLHPDIGGVFIKIDPKAKLIGGPPAQIRKQLYSLPPVPITKL